MLWITYCTFQPELSTAVEAAHGSERVPGAASDGNFCSACGSSVMYRVAVANAAEAEGSTEEYGIFIAWANAAVEARTLNVCLSFQNLRLLGADSVKC